MRSLLLIATLATTLSAAPLSVTVSTPATPRTDGFKMGTARAPNGDTLTLDSRSLLLNGKRWTPVMGEFHYSRYPAAEWREELLKMKAGGVDIVATYVFWIHHEEVEGVWDWTGNKDLHRFLEIIRDAGLKCIVRCGPWSHGEVRNGGLPDWIVARGKERSEDPEFMESTTRLYGQIAAQLKGMLWKDGGPVVGIQLDNEYGGPASYLLALKAIARDAGLDVPLYTRTGWPALKTAMPFGEMVPLYGVYAEGFWDRQTTSMPGSYWAGFHFSPLRIDSNIASDALGHREVKDPEDVSQYPYLTCEIGGGMMSSYHRRILVDPRDILSTTLVKIGSGSVSPGYYMYHGGTNPEGRTTLMEEQATLLTNSNDMPVKNYDFQAPLGQYGQTRPQYYMLRPLHAFLHEFGDQLAAMDAFMPDRRPGGKDDMTTLRWAVRSDGQRGFVFVNNYERGRALPPKNGVQFAVKLADGSTLTIPETPVPVPGSVSFFWPFNLDLQNGVTLRWATAQPVSLQTPDPFSPPTLTLVETPGIVSILCLGPEAELPGEGTVRVADGGAKLLELHPGQRAAIRSSTAADYDYGLLYVEVISPPPTVAGSASTASVRTDVSFELIHPAGPAREIPLATTRQAVAVEPDHKDFESAAVWRIRLPADVEPARDDLLLRLHYVGDVARVYLDGRFITDDFYNGNPLEIGIRRHAAALMNGDLTIAILPLRKDAITGENPKIFMAESAKPDFGGADSIATLKRIELVPRGNTAPNTSHQ